MRHLIILFLVSVSILSCKSESGKLTLDNNTDKSTNILPGAPESFIKELYEKVDHIDYFFRGTNFSVSQDNKKATQAFIATLSPSKATSVSDTCKPPLRVTYLSQGEILAESEMYLTAGCQYIEYFVNNKKTYQNSFSQQGYNFIMSVLKSAQNGQQQ